MNDKTVGGWPYIVEGKTSDQRQFAPVSRRQDFHVGCRNNTSGLHTILKFSSERAESDHVSGPNLAKGPEETVAMAREPDVS